MNIIFEDKIRRNSIIRILFLPITRLAKRIEVYKYLSSDDSRYLRSLHNTHNGEDAFIVANGPSLIPEDLEKLNGYFSIAVNRIFDLYRDVTWRPSVYMVTDKSLIHSFKKKKLNPPEAETILINDKELADFWRKKSNTHEIKMYGYTPVRRETLVNKTVCKDIYKFFTPSQSVIYNAFELAFYMGFKNIYLIGADHSFRVEIGLDGKKKYNDNVKAHFDKCELQGNYESCKEALTKCYETLHMYAEKNGIKIYNATRGGELDVFPRITLENVV